MRKGEREGEREMVSVRGGEREEKRKSKKREGEREGVTERGGESSEGINPYWSLNFRHIPNLLRIDEVR